VSVSVRVADVRLKLGGRDVLRGVDLEVNPGEIVGIMGLSGSGKTSLLKCMAGLQRATSGEIWIGESNLSLLDERALNRERRRIGMVFQYAALFDSLSVRDNVVFGPKFHRTTPEHELKGLGERQLAAVGLSGTESLFPAQLSGGMRKRVGLARALAMAPDVVFYDEPTSGLDPVVAAMIDDLIVRVRRELQITSVIVTHDVPSVLRCADRVAFLHDGQIQAFETPTELRQSRNPLVRQFIEGRATGPLGVGSSQSSESR
jgi:phospholipid/cholesterol/gamma-HCH transport system ATP-binding protein